MQVEGVGEGRTGLNYILSPRLPLIEPRDWMHN